MSEEPAEIKNTFNRISLSEQAGQTGRRRQAGHAVKLFQQSHCSYLKPALLLGDLHLILAHSLHGPAMMIFEPLTRRPPEGGSPNVGVDSEAGNRRQKQTRNGEAVMTDSDY